ncbi:arylsulfatase B-like [Macrosteles quadrilineatus]|uniref:arylsulfatase B-like n=1 Tax=Macrosteles quadrilineatus TaxID=74068 RepID=UPI0023E20CDE|nr:arylsulfatase B-like [Macrosteles quadrilineatus]
MFRVLTCFLLAVVCAEPPNIVIIVADDLGWNDVSFHGSSQIPTPNIDALAYDGLILNRHYAQPSCSPSRAALLSGRYPAYTGVQMPFKAGTTSALPLHFTLLPEYLSRLGYRSHLVGKWHLGCHKTEYLPCSRGFQSHFGFWNGYLGYFDGIHLDGVGGIDSRRNNAGAWEEFVGRYATDLFAEEATSIIKSHDVTDGPLFLQVALSAPHTGNKGSEFEVRNLAENERQHYYIKDLHRRLYAGMVRGMDDAVGAIVEALGSRNMLNNSIVLFTSDNGAPTLDPRWNYSNYGSNWPLRGMKLSCHEGGVRVASVLWSPLVAGGRVSDQLIHMVDWLPTLYTAAGGAAEDLGEMDGVSQWETLRDGKSTAKRTEILVELNNVNGNEALIQWPWKIVKYASSNPTFNIHAGESGKGAEVPPYSVEEVLKSTAAKAISLHKSTNEILALRSSATIDTLCPLVLNHSTPHPCDQHYCLFNLETDPCETLDLSVAHSDVARDLVKALEGYREGLVLTPRPNSDPRADPRLWGNYWSTWADSSASLPQTSVMLLVTSYLILR